MAATMHDLLTLLVERGASDLHITTGTYPQLRVHGKLATLTQFEQLAPADTQRLAYSVLNEGQKQKFEEENELDLSFGIQGLARFRCNIYRQRGAVACAIRVIPTKIKGFHELGLPSIVEQLADRPKGLVNQREVFSDTQSFKNALKYILRQDPDVVLVGEMRDLETIAAALTIAETGHLAFAPLHTNSAMESINRIIDVFPSHQQAQVRAQLSFVLEGVITQTLLQKAKGRGRVMACEILIMTPAVRALIRDEKIEQNPSMMQAGKKHGMQTLNDALYQLYVSREVTKDECLRVTSTPNEFLRMIGEAPLDEREPIPSGGQPAGGASKVAARR